MMAYYNYAILFPYEYIFTDLILIAISVPGKLKAAITSYIYIHIFVYVHVYFCNLWCDNTCKYK